MDLPFYLIASKFGDKVHCTRSAGGISLLECIIGNPVSLGKSVKTDAQLLSHDK